MPKSDLPFGSEFSPSQIDLIRVLEMAEEYSGDWHALENSIRQEYFDSHSTSEYNRRKLANNCKYGKKRINRLFTEGFVPMVEDETDLFIQQKSSSCNPGRRREKRNGKTYKGRFERKVAF